MHKTKHQHAVSRLSSLIEHLHVQAQQTDKANSTKSSHRLLENNNLFSQHLFNTQSDQISEYVTEIQKRLNEFSRLCDTSDGNANKVEFAKSSLEHLEQQISAILSALKANQSMHQAAKANFEIKKRIKANSVKKAQQLQSEKYNKMAKTVLLSSHQLYQQLNEHHEFERRLLDMITEREQQMARARNIVNDKVSHEILSLHQRLGRCRKAISVIERNIEQSEKKQLR